MIDSRPRRHRPLPNLSVYNRHLHVGRIPRVLRASPLRICKSRASSPPRWPLSYPPLLCSITSAHVLPQHAGSGRNIMVVSSYLMRKRDVVCPSINFPIQASSAFHFSNCIKEMQKEVTGVQLWPRNIFFSPATNPPVFRATPPLLHTKNLCLPNRFFRELEASLYISFYRVLSVFCSIWALVHRCYGMARRFRNLKHLADTL